MVQEEQNFKARGLAVVIYNSYENCPDTNTLPGATKDGEAMINTFKSLQFAVLDKQNATRDDVLGIFQAVASYADYPVDYECFAIVFAGHGKKDSILLAIDGEFNFEEVIVKRLNKHLHPFDISDRITRVPIIAFIDACRGSMIPRDASARLNERDIPKNMMLNYSTREEDKSYENPNRGGFWMQEIAKDLRTKNKPVSVIVAGVSKKMKKQNPISINTDVDIILYKGKI